MENWSTLIVFILATASHAYREDGQYPDNDLSGQSRHLGRRRRPGSQNESPCNFAGGNGKPKNQPQGRTFFDLQFLNLEHNYNYNINCGSNGGTYPVYPQPAPVHEILPGEDNGGHKPGGHKPIGGGGGGGGHRPFNRPGKPGGGGLYNNHGGGGGPFGGGNNRPQRPFQGGHSQQSSSFGESSNLDILTPGQYLVVSNPHLGSFTHDISAFNPTNLYNKLKQGAEEVLDELGSYF